MSSRRADPNFLQVSGYIPTELAFQFNVWCASSQVTKAKGLEQAIKLLIQQSPRPKIEIKKAPETLAELVKQNHYELVSDGKLTAIQLSDIIDNRRPSDAELLKIAAILDWDEDELREMRARQFGE